MDLEAALAEESEPQLRVALEHELAEARARERRTVAAWEAEIHSHG